MQQIMQSNGLRVEVHAPIRKAATQTELADYDPCPVYSVAQVDPAHIPLEWRDPVTVRTVYFLGVQADREYWFDLNSNHDHPHDVAVVPTMQGLNVLTGKMHTSNRTEQYRMECPIHHTLLRADRFCSECWQVWPYQNYLSTTTHASNFWVDCWRMPDGKVHRFTFDPVFDSYHDGFFKAQFSFHLSHQAKIKRVDAPGHSARAGSVNLFSPFDPEFEPTEADLPFFGNRMSELLAGSDEGPCESGHTDINLRREPARNLPDDLNPPEFWQSIPTTVLTLYFVNKTLFNSISRQR